uniref:hypothetical protein n=1 Tax=Flavobacterium beibuense TaxID=657326 RepID=UPI00373FDA23
MLIDYRVTNENDKKAMGMMLRRAKTILRSNQFTTLYDKGYHTGSEFCISDQLGIATLVAIPEIGRTSQAPNPDYNAETLVMTIYRIAIHVLRNIILYPIKPGIKLEIIASSNTKPRLARPVVRNQCTTSKINGKVIQRSEFTQNIRNNAQRVYKNPLLYKKRQALVEHPF